MSGEIHFKRTTVGEEILGIRLDSNLSDFFNKSFQCLGMQSKWECEEWVPSVLIGDDITFDSGSEKLPDFGESSLLHRYIRLEGFL